MIGVEKNKTPELVSWLSGEDVPTNKQVKDRVLGVMWTMEGSATYNATTKTYNTLNGGLFLPYNTHFNLGVNFDILFDIDIKIRTDNSTMFRFGNNAISLPSCFELLYFSIGYFGSIQRYVTPASGSRTQVKTDKFANYERVLVKYKRRGDIIYTYINGTLSSYTELKNPDNIETDTRKFVGNNFPITLAYTSKGVGFQYSADMKIHDFKIIRYV